MKRPVKKSVQTSNPEIFAGKTRQQNYFMLFPVFLSIVLYFNTSFNEYALDDYLVVSQNSYTQKGISGIPDLVSKTSYFGFFKNNKEEVTLRYRPLVMISYALEIQFFQNKKILLFISHLVNVLLFAFAAYIVFRLFDEYIFANNKPAGFMASLLFVIHPIHTESVANIKGRDEIMSFLFTMLAIWYVFKYIKHHQRSSYILSVIFFLAGLFSKENTISLLLILPMVVYFFSEESFQRILKLMVPFFLVATAYILLRFSITGLSSVPSGDILNNPYLNADAEQKYATILLCLGFYLKLLFFPHPLSYDYTFNQIMLVKFSDWRVLISLLVHLALLAIAFQGWKKKSLIAFGILFYFFTIILVSNIFINLGAFIGERLLFTPSLGFCMVMAILLDKLFVLIKEKNSITGTWFKRVALSLLIVFAGFKTISRNTVWKNNFTLMTTDVKASPESMKANDACAISYILATDEPGVSNELKKKYLYSAIHYDHKASEIMPSFTDVYFNLGAAFSRLELPDSAEYFWNIARKQKPMHQKLAEYDKILGVLFLKRGLSYAVDKNMESCFTDLNKSVMYDSLNVEAWYNYGGALYSVQRYDEAKRAFVKVLQIDPSHVQARQGLNSLIMGK